MQLWFEILALLFCFIKFVLTLILSFIRSLNCPWETGCVFSLLLFSFLLCYLQLQSFSHAQTMDTITCYLVLVVVRRKGSHYFFSFFLVGVGGLSPNYERIRITRVHIQESLNLGAVNSWTFFLVHVRITSVSFSCQFVLVFYVFAMGSSCYLEEKLT